MQVCLVIHLLLKLLLIESNICLYLLTPEVTVTSAFSSCINKCFQDNG